MEAKEKPEEGEGKEGVKRMPICDSLLIKFKGSLPWRSHMFSTAIIPSHNSHASAATRCQNDFSCVSRARLNGGQRTGNSSKIQGLPTPARGFSTLSALPLPPSPFFTDSLFINVRVSYFYTDLYICVHEMWMRACACVAEMECTSNKLEADLLTRVFTV
jgi:hypothetical protein